MYVSWHENCCSWLCHMARNIPDLYHKSVTGVSRHFSPVITACLVIYALGLVVTCVPPYRQMYRLLPPVLLCSATLCHTLLVAPGGPPGPLAAHHSSSMMAGTQASHNSSSSCKQQLPGMGSQQPGLQQQSDDAMLAYMQRLEEHRKRCELSGR